MEPKGETKFSYRKYLVLTSTLWQQCRVAWAADTSICICLEPLLVVSSVTKSSLLFVTEDLAEDPSRHNESCFAEGRDSPNLIPLLNHNYPTHKLFGRGSPSLRPTCNLNRRRDLSPGPRRVGCAGPRPAL